MIYGIKCIGKENMGRPDQEFTYRGCEVWCANVVKNGYQPCLYLDLNEAYNYLTRHWTHWTHWTPCKSWYYLVEEYPQ